MRKAAFIGAVAVWLAAAFSATQGFAQAFTEDRHIRDIEERLAQLRPEPSTAIDLNKLMQRLAGCWNVPPELAKPSRLTSELVVSVRIDLERDGSLAAPPTVTNHSANPLFDKAAASAIRAVRACAPFDFLPAAAYAQWKTLVIDFDPRMLFPPR